MTVATWEADLWLQEQEQDPASVLAMVLPVLALRVVTVLCHTQWLVAMTEEATWSRALLTVVMVMVMVAAVGMPPLLPLLLLLLSVAAAAATLSALGLLVVMMVVVVVVVAVTEAKLLRAVAVALLAAMAAVQVMVQAGVLVILLLAMMPATVLVVRVVVVAAAVPGHMTTMAWLSVSKTALANKESPFRLLFSFFFCARHPLPSEKSFLTVRQRRCFVQIWLMDPSSVVMIGLQKVGKTRLTNLPDAVFAIIASSRVLRVQDSKEPAFSVVASWSQRIGVDCLDGARLLLRPPTVERLDSADWAALRTCSVTMRQTVDAFLDSHCSVFRYAVSRHHRALPLISRCGPTVRELHFGWPTDPVGRIQSDARFRTDVERLRTEVLRLSPFLRIVCLDGMDDTFRIKLEPIVVGCPNLTRWWSPGFLDALQVAANQIGPITELDVKEHPFRVLSSLFSPLPVLAARVAPSLTCLTCDASLMSASVVPADGFPKLRRLDCRMIGGKPTHVEREIARADRLDELELRFTSLADTADAPIRIVAPRLRRITACKVPSVGLDIIAPRLSHVELHDVTTEVAVAVICGAPLLQWVHVGNCSRSICGNEERLAESVSAFCGRPPPAQLTAFRYDRICSAAVLAMVLHCKSLSWLVVVSEFSYPADYARLVAARLPCLVTLVLDDLRPFGGVPALPPAPDLGRYASYFGTASTS